MSKLVNNKQPQPSHNTPTATDILVSVFKNKSLYAGLSLA